MKIIDADPPNIDEIAAAFPKRPLGTIYCYGDTIYNPAGRKLDDSLIAHESIHQQRQADDPAGWWKRYLVDAAFRLEEEIPAHRAEYDQFCRTQRDRNLRGFQLLFIAGRLSGPLYGGLINRAKAVAAILGK